MKKSLVFMVALAVMISLSFMATSDVYAIENGTIEQMAQNTTTAPSTCTAAVNDTSFVAYNADSTRGHPAAINKNQSGLERNAIVLQDSGTTSITDYDVGNIGSEDSTISENTIVRVDNDIGRTAISRNTSANLYIDYFVEKSQLSVDPYATCISLSDNIRTDDSVPMSSGDDDYGDGFDTYARMKAGEHTVLKLS